MSLPKRYPALFAFGNEPIPPLSKEEERSASRDERIKSVWPYLVKTVLEFAETLRPREAANFDPEDILTELWVKLAAKDDKFDPARGRYVSFAASVAENELKRIRDRAKTVKPPGNPSARMKDYEIRLAEGTLSDKQAETMTDLKRVLGSQASLSKPSGDGRAETYHIADYRTADAEYARREDIGRARHAVTNGLLLLTIYEARLLGEAYGLWGATMKTHAEMAASRSRSVATIRRQIETALDVCSDAIGPIAA